MNMRYLNARWTLGWALIKHILLRPFIRPDPGLWVQRINQDFLGPTPLAAWNYFAGSSRCIGCGLCDAVAPGDAKPSEWILGSIRQPSDAPLALAKAKQLRELAGAIERVCPARVSVGDVADLIEANAHALRVNPLRSQTKKS